MRRLSLLTVVALAACVPSAVEVAPPPAIATITPNPVVGGIQIPATRSLAAIEQVPLLATFANIQRTAGGLDRLSDAGPFTVFAPTDTAFAGLAPGVSTRLLDAENRALLTRLAAYHIVAGRLDTAELRRRVTTTGTITLTTLAGDPLVVSAQGPALVLTDANGNRCYLEIADVRLSNGILHVVNGVLVPTL